MADQFLTEDLPRAQVRFHWLAGFRAEAERAGFVLRSASDVTRAALPSTQRMLEELARRAPELEARFSRERPGIARDLQDMLTCGRAELAAIESGHLRYVLHSFDRPA